MRKLMCLGLVLGLGFLAAKKTSVGSYAGALWSHVRSEARQQVPTRFELERVRHEITQLDSDVNRMIRPIAEHLAGIQTLQKELVLAEGQLENHKKTLLTMSRDLEGSPTQVVYAGESYSADRVQAKLQRDFASFKRLESHVKSQRKLLDAKEASLKASQDQLAKVLTKKREYEIRLAQLAADEETLKISKLGTAPALDDSRASLIESALQGIEQRQAIERAEIELRTGQFANDPIPVDAPASPDVRAIRKYLEGAE